MLLHFEGDHGSLLMFLCLFLFSELGRNTSVFTGGPGYRCAFAIRGVPISMLSIICQTFLFRTFTIFIFLNKFQKSPWFMSLALTLSMAAPYIISYSSGVQLHLFRRTFDQSQGLKKLLMMLFLLPTGILYFVCLDLLDIFVHLFRWIYFVLCCKSLQKIAETEDILAEQVPHSISCILKGG